MKDQIEYLKAALNQNLASIFGTLEAAADGNQSLSGQMDAIEGLINDARETLGQVHELAEQMADAEGNEEPEAEEADA